MTLPRPGVLYFEPPVSSTMSTKATVASLRLGGYKVFHAPIPEVFAELARNEGPAGNDALSALVIDTTVNEDMTAQVVDFVRTDPQLQGLPRVHLISAKEPSNPFEPGVRYLRRPLATPALIKSLRDGMHTDLGSGVGYAEPGNEGLVQLSSMTLPNNMLDGYEVLDEIASGGMATVFLARRRNATGFERLFAIKLMHPHLARNPEFLAMFLDEAALASRLHHPNVASVVDAGHEDGPSRGRPYAVMEYVEGCSLAQLLPRARNDGDLARLMPIIVDTLTGLQAAHELTDDDGRLLNFVHRDVSPHNILVGVDGVARISDFGVAKARARLTHTRQGVRKGRLTYMAPEVFQERATLDARADIFAMGAVLWNILTRKRLFAAGSEAAVIRNVLEATIPEPSSVNPAVPKALDPICMRALARNPADRYATAIAMANDLRAASLEQDLFAPTNEIGKWVQVEFADKLAERRVAVRRARAQSQSPVSSASHHGITRPAADPEGTPIPISLATDTFAQSTPVPRASTRTWRVAAVVSVLGVGTWALAERYRDRGSDRADVVEAGAAVRRPPPPPTTPPDVPQPGPSTASVVGRRAPSPPPKSRPAAPPTPPPFGVRDDFPPPPPTRTASSKSSTSKRSGSRRRTTATKAGTTRPSVARSRPTPGSDAPTPPPVDDTPASPRRAPPLGSEPEINPYTRRDRASAGT